MKAYLKFTGIFCVVLIIGFAMAACDDPVASVTDPFDYYGLNIVGISVYAQPNKMVYDFLEPFNPEGMIVMALLDNGKMTPVTGFTFSDLYADEAGVFPVIISYKGFETTFSVFVYTDKERAVKPKAFIVNPDGEDIEIICMSITGVPLSVPAGTQYYVTTGHEGTGDVEIWYCQQNNLTPSRGGQRAELYGTNPPHPAETAPRRNASTNASGATTIRFVTTDWGYGNSPHYIDSESLVLQFIIE